MIVASKDDVSVLSLFDNNARQPLEPTRALRQHAIEAFSQRAVLTRRGLAVLGRKLIKGGDLTRIHRAFGDDCSWNWHETSPCPGNSPRCAPLPAMSIRDHHQIFLSL